MGQTLLVGLLLLIGNAFFVLAEYGIVGSRRTKLEALARKGSRRAKRVLAVLDDLTTYVAGTQVGITLLSIAIGALTEEPLAIALAPHLAFLPRFVVNILAVLVVAFPMVVLAELVPKYVSLKYAERMALLTVDGLQLAVVLLKPLVWLTESCGAWVLKLFRVDADQARGTAVSREEFALLVRAGREQGHFDEPQADLLTRALKLDALDAHDVMIHRLDVKFLQADTPREELLAKLADLPHSRIPVCRGDLDEVVGVAYVQDILRNWSRPDFKLEDIVRSAEFVPENLTLDRIVGRMREAHTQILIVRDEYGGTAGLLTLEDVVEEVFGEIEDRLEAARPPIERAGPHRVTARADVRYDELLHFLEIQHEPTEVNTETLATLVMEGLQRVPRLGDAVELPIGTLRVENMARRRITRVAVTLRSHSEHLAG